MNPVKPSDANKPIKEVTPMIGRPRFGSMPRQILLLGLNLKLLPWLEQRRWAVVPAHAD
jgi:hypothetical protein